ncbi:MAG: c-type cytochrome [Bacteroidia bacterium]|nr:c-type cytochrome [Bacteroidia bacterium]
MNILKRKKQRIVKIKQKLILLFNIIFFGVIPINIYSQDSEAIFKKACASCHTIGGGRLVGPDLQGITLKRDNNWLVKFITNSQSLINSGDADAVSIAAEYNNSVMPPATISEGEINSIISLIDSKGSGGPKKKTVDYLLKATSENVTKGYYLFTGRKRFKNNGPTCISCHTVNCIGNGGLLAKDLTLSYNTMKGEGIKALLESPAFPAMLNAYSNNKLEENEIYNLAAFLRSTATYKIPSKYYEPKIANKFYLFGITGFLFFVLLFYAGWHFRKRKSVNYDILKRQLNTEK